MTPTITLVRDNLSDTLPRYAEVMGRTMSDTVKRAAKGVTRRVIAITPPAHFDSASDSSIVGAAAYRYGRTKIRKDMEGVLAPVKLKGKRTVSVVFGHPLKKPIIIKTAERYPDVVATYRQHRTFRKSGVGVRARNLRDRKYYVDQRKFNRLLKDKEGNVGKLASGFAEGAAALDIPLQNWISRHGRGRGAVKLDLLSARMRITVMNYTPAGLPDNVRAELERRVGYAVRYQRAAMLREVEYYAMKKARDLGIRTRNFDQIVPEGMSGRSDT